MPEFSHPFGVKKCEQKLSQEELIRAVRFSIASEFEAIQIYEEIAESIDNEDAKKLMLDIADEEKFYKDGKKEASELLKEK